MTPKKKRNKQDLTLINLRAMKKRIESLELRVDILGDLIDPEIAISFVRFIEKKRREHFKNQRRR